MSLEVLELYGAASLQGQEAPGRRAFGVPPGGAFDRESLTLANALLGNSEGMPAIELTMGSAIFRADGRLDLAVVGAPCEIRVGDGEHRPNSGFSLRGGDLMKLAPPTAGARIYLAVAGGWAEKGAVKRHGRIEAAKPSLTPMPESIRLAEPPTSLGLGPFRIVAGPQAPMFDIEEWATNEFEVSTSADRVGIRLIGPSAGEPREITSEPACLGTVQIANDGQPIILGPDGPTIGGYPKIAVVCEADSDRLGQLRPGLRIRFELISIDQARTLKREATRRMERRVADIRLAANQGR